MLSLDPLEQEKCIWAQMKRQMKVPISFHEAHVKWQSCEQKKSLERSLHFTVTHSLASNLTFKWSSIMLELKINVATFSWCNIQSLLSQWALPWLFGYFFVLFFLIQAQHSYVTFGISWQQEFSKFSPTFLTHIFIRRWYWGRTRLDEPAPQ